MKKLTLNQMTQQALIAALYVVLTLSAGNLSYGPIQFRYSEVLNLLAFFNPISLIGISVGVFISNLWSTLGMFDVLFGTLHTIISLFFITRSKNIIVASIWPTVFSFIIGYELSFIFNFGAFHIMTAQVMLSEFIIMTVISVPLYKLIHSKSPKFINLISDQDRLIQLGYK